MNMMKQIPIILLLGLIVAFLPHDSAASDELPDFIYKCNGLLNYNYFFPRQGLIQALNEAGIGNSEARKTIRAFLSDPENFKGNFAKNLELKVELTRIRGKELGSAPSEKEIENINWMVNTLGRSFGSLEKVDLIRIKELTAKEKKFPGALASLLNSVWAFGKVFHIGTTESLILHVQDIADWSTAKSPTIVAAPGVLEIFGIHASPFFKEASQLDQSLESFHRKYFKSGGMVLESEGAASDLVLDSKLSAKLLAELTYRDLKGTLSPSELMTRLQTLQEVGERLVGLLDHLEATAEKWQRTEIGSKQYELGYAVRDARSLLRELQETISRSLRSSTR